MPALWILLVLFGLLSSIYNFYELLIGPIPSNEDQLIKKDIILVYGIFMFGIGVLFHGIIRLCIHYTGPDFMKGFFGVTVAGATILIFFIVGSLLKKKYKKSIYIKKRKSTNMPRISVNKSMYYFFLVLLLVNLFSGILLRYAENHSVNGLFIGIYIFYLCSLTLCSFFLFHHRYIKNKQK